jgi:N-acetylglucosaminyldiphosphoundecaprenol N-acetyl-beta-D-mannosaminyltransferase
MRKNIKNTIKKDGNYVTILGVKVLSTTTSLLLASVTEKISHNAKFAIMTPNPELVLASTKNSELKISLNSASFSVPDGVGLNYASRFLNGQKLTIIPGRELFLDLIKQANERGWKVFLLGGYNHEAELTAKKLAAQYSNIKIAFDQGPNLTNQGVPVTEVDTKKEKDVIDKINKFTPKFTFVAFGNPKQEIWIYKNLSNLKTGGAMSVGGTFRYIAGMSPFPPKWMVQLGLEWLFRLVTEPYRLGRIFRAVIVFPLRVLASKIFSV